LQPEFAIIVIIAAVFIGLSKGGLGGPVPVALLTPLLSLVLPASQAVGIVLPLLILADMIALRFYWQKWDWSLVRQMLPAAVIGVICGGVLLLTLANGGHNLLLRRVIGVFTLIVVIYKVGGGYLTQLEYQPRNWHGYLAGWASGFGSALANVGAPPFTAYMMLRQVPPIPFIGTTTLLFAIVNALKLPLTLLSSNVLNPHLLLSILWVVPLIPVGVLVGRWSVKRMNPVHFDRLMLGLLFILGVFMLVYDPGR
jgi:uncharacterized membrane protein YfcA